METIVEVVRAAELEASIENGCALVDIFAHGEVDLADGRVIGAPDEMGFYLTEFFELLMAAMPAVGLNVANWRAAYFARATWSSRSRDVVADAVRRLPLHRAIDRSLA